MAIAGTFLHILAGDLWGGKEAQMSVQLRALREQGVDVQALLFNDTEVAGRYRDSGIPVMVAEESPGIRSLCAVALRNSRECGARAIIAHGYKEAAIGMWCAWRLGIPLAVIFHGAAEPYPGTAGWKMKVYEGIALAIARMYARKAVCVSRALSRTLGLASHSKLAVIPNVRTEQHPGGSDSGFGYRPAIYAIGRLVRVKRFDVAIGALRFLKDARLFIAGSGPEENRLKEFAVQSGLNDRVEFLGYRSDATSLIAAADLLVISSDSEGIPTVLLDALGAGRPIVTTRVGGIPEVLENFPGYPVEMVDPGNPEALGAAAARLLSRSVSAPPETARTLEALFSPTRAAADHEKLYREITEAPL